MECGKCKANERRDEENFINKDEKERERERERKENNERQTDQKEGCDD